ncbi:MAG: McrC family protein [Actinomycetota bacterium]|nr:McrC family protein [Actinomycetota bacterium]
MLPKPVSIHEVGETTVPELTQAEGRELYLSFGRDPQRLGVRQDMATGAVILEGKGYAGVIALGNGRVVRIRTKVRAESIFYLIGFTQGTHRFFDREVRYQTTADFWEVIIAEFARRVADLLRYGLHQGYVETEDDALPALRGRLLVGRQLRVNFVRRERLACRYEEFTPDLLMNRALKLATFLATRFAYRDRRIRQQLDRNMHLFGGVSLVHLEAHAPRRVVLDRLTESYRLPLFLASLVIGSVTLEDRLGEEPFASYLVDMPTLFEQFVKEMLRRELAGTGFRVVAQEKRALDVEGRLSFIPDITIWRGSRCLAVLDTKYKPYVKLSTSAGKPVEGDVNQVLVYGQALGAERVVLVYPETVSDRFPMPTGLRDIDVMGFELSGTPDEIDARARDFVKRLLRDVLQATAAA